MPNNISKIFTWHLRRSLNQLGLPGVAGVGLLAFCVIFFFSAVIPVGKEVQSLGHEAESMRTRAKPSAELLGQQPAGQLGAFYKNFPDIKAVPDALERLHQAAATQGVTLEQGEYHYVHSDTDKLVRYEMSLPVKGEYLQVRKFISQLLAMVPYASLDSVDFQRQKISDTMIEAQVKVTLYLLKG